jgi:hypothetical protein
MAYMVRVANLMMWVVMALLVVARQTGGVQVQNDVECDVCRKITDTVERVLVMNATTTKQFQTVAKKLCIYLPEDLKYACEMSVKRLPSSIFRCLIQEAEMHTICNDPDVGLCMAPSKALPAVKCNDLIDGDMPACQACKFTVGSLEHYTANDPADTLAAMAGVCTMHYGASSIAKKCEKLIESHGRKMLDLILKRIDSEDYCCSTGVCKPPPLYLDKKTFQVPAVMDPIVSDMMKDADQKRKVEQEMRGAATGGSSNEEKEEKAEEAALEANGKAKPTEDEAALDEADQMEKEASKAEQ